MSITETVVVAAARLSVYDRPNATAAKVERQVIAGDRLYVTRCVADECSGSEEAWAQIVAQKDGYEGYVEKAHLAQTPANPTHVVAAREAPVTPLPQVKNGPSSGVLFMGSKVAVSGWSDDGAWAQIKLEQDRPLGWVFAGHLRTTDTLARDPVEVARTFLGSPYVWGGNTGRGIDCSGLVQAALLACGIPCKGDSGPQHDTFVEPDRYGPYEAGELLFWRGHVAMATGPDRLIHATAHSMSVIEEPIEPALKRIANQGDAPWRGRGRPR